MQVLKIISLAIGFSAIFPGVLSSEEFRVADLIISNPIIRATPPHAPVSVGYLKIRNTGNSSERLLGISASFAKNAEMHVMKMKSGIMTMRPMTDGLEIPAGDEVTLKPGGLHIMFMKLSAQMKAGEERSVNLVFKNAGELAINFEVQPFMRIQKNKILSDQESNN